MRGAWVFAASVLASPDRDLLTGWRAASSTSPRVTYRYQDVPLCEMALPQENALKPTGTLAQWWNGGAPIASVLSMAVDKPLTEICVARVRRREADLLSDMIKKDFWYSYLPHDGGSEVRVPVGQINDTAALIYAHKTFHVFGDRISVVPSVPLALRPDHDLRLTYDVLHYPPREHPSSSPNDTVLLYNSLCIWGLAGLLWFAFKSEARVSPLRGFDPRSTPQHFALLTVLIGVGSQLALTLVLFAVLTVLTSLRRNVYDYSVYKILIAFALSYVVNGFSVFRIYKREANVGKVTIAALLAVPLAVFCIMWHINVLTTSVGSSRSISMFRLFFKLAALIVFVFAPLHLTGAALGAKYSRSKTSSPVMNGVLKTVPENLGPDHLSTATPLLLGLIPFGSVVLIISLFNEATFGPHQDVFVNPFSLLASVFTTLMVIAGCSIMAVYTSLCYANADWTKIPLGMAASSSLSTLVWTLGFNLPKYLTSAPTGLEFITFNGNFAVAS